jgi:general secretion pathway protein L
MADSLLLRLPHGAQSQATWLAAGNAGASPESGPLSLAAARAGARPVIVLVPGADVLLTHAELPPARSGVKLQQLVPFALEEQLAEDIETLHFAIGRRNGAGRTPVAVVARRRMDEWLAALRAGGIEPAALYADSQLLPRNPAQAVALLEADSVTVRTPGGEVLMLDAEALGEALELARDEEASRGLILYTGAAEWQRHAAQVEALRERFEALQVQRLPGDALALLAQGLPSSEAINLLQGPYAPSGSMISGWRAWRWAAVLLVALIALHLIGQTVELVVLHRRERALDAAIAQVFHAALPGTSAARGARRRIAARLAEVRAAQSGGGFLNALAALAQAGAAAPGLQLKALTFRSGSVTLSVTAPSVEALNQLAQSLEHEGWQARLTGGNPTHGGFEGGIRMHRGS